MVGSGFFAAFASFNPVDMGASVGQGQQNVIQPTADNTILFVMTTDGNPPLQGPAGDLNIPLANATLSTYTDPVNGFQSNIIHFVSFPPF
jgi:hypothetical protein